MRNNEFAYLSNTGQTRLTIAPWVGTAATSESQAIYGGTLHDALAPYQWSDSVY